MKTTSKGMSKKVAKPKKVGAIKKSGSYKGKSNKLGYGGRSSQLKGKLQAKGLPAAEVGGIIGKLARKAGAAPGMSNYHGKKGK